MKIKRTLAVILSFVLAAVLLSACKEKTEPAASIKESKWKVGDNLKLDWYINFNTWEYPSQLWESATVLKEISEITGVTPQIRIPSGDPTEKLNIMIATNDMPDLLTLSVDDASLTKMTKQGLLYSIDELSDRYVPEFKKEIPDEVWTYTKSIDDRKLYGLPSFFIPRWRVDEMDDLGQHTYNVKKDIYKELGSPSISTPDELISVLKRFKEKYPTINGKKSIPISLHANAGALYMIERSFGIKQFYVEKDGTVSIKYKDPEYKKVIEYLVRLNKESLMDTEMFIKKSDQINEDLASGRVFCIPTTFDSLWTVDSALDKVKPDSHFIAVEPMSNVENPVFTVPNKLGWTISVIPKSSKKAEETLKFMRYMWSEEGNLLCNFGHEGEHYTLTTDENGRKVVNKTQTAMDREAADLMEYRRETGIRAFRLFYYPYWKSTNLESEDRIADRKIANKYTSMDDFIFRMNMTPESTSDVGIINNQISGIVSKSLPKFVLCDDLNTAMTAYKEMMAEIENSGLSELEAFLSETYAKNKIKLNIK